MRAAVWRSLVETKPSFAALVARVTIGGVMLPHGFQKTLGWFGGYGFKGTMGYFTGTMHIPWVFACAAILAESLGAVFLIAGAATRVAAAAIAAVMVMAVATTHWESGFFMNWFGSQKGEGFEYHLLMFGLCTVSVVLGGGTASVDGLLKDKDP